VVTPGTDPALAARFTSRDGSDRRGAIKPRAVASRLPRSFAAPRKAARSAPRRYPLTWIKRSTWLRRSVVGGSRAGVPHQQCQSGSLPPVPGKVGRSTRECTQNGVGNGAVSVSGGMAACYRSGYLVSRRRGALSYAEALATGNAITRNNSTSRWTQKFARGRRCACRPAHQ
jgi:hypothetical protein